MEMLTQLKYRSMVEQGFCFFFVFFWGGGAQRGNPPPPPPELCFNWFNDEINLRMIN